MLLIVDRSVRAHRQAPEGYRLQTTYYDDVKMISIYVHGEPKNWSILKVSDDTKGVPYIIMFCRSVYEIKVKTGVPNVNTFQINSHKQ